MKKTSISLAILATMIAPSAGAETTLYGRLDTMLNYIDGDAKAFDVDGNRDPANDIETEGAWGINTRTTRIGVKGSDDLGNGLRAIFQAEWAFDSASGGSTAGGLKNRLAYAGLNGGWGKAAIGRQWTPYYGSANKTDIFNNDAYNAYYFGLFRTGNSVLYETPNFSGFTASLMAILDGANEAKSGVDAWNISGDYENGPASIGISYVKSYEAGDKDDSHLLGASGSWNFGMAKLIAQYENGEKVFSGTDADDLESWAIAGEFYLGNNTLRGIYGNAEIGKVDGTTWALSWQYNFSKRTRTYVEYGEPSGVGRNSDGTYTVLDGDVFTLGFRHDF